jgi:hypothetical protein
VLKGATKWKQQANEKLHTKQKQFIEQLGLNIERKKRKFNKRSDRVMMAKKKALSRFTFILKPKKNVNLYADIFFIFCTHGIKNPKTA